jgi:uncharacterized repeat protein (TIGR03806 family)
MTLSPHHGVRMHLRAVALLLVACTPTVEEDRPEVVVTAVPGWVSRVDPEPAGDSCPAGGVAIHGGWDDGSGGGVAGDGQLQDGEILTTTLVCNGESGHDGLVEITDEEPGPWCAFGGVRISVGTDDGAEGGNADDGTLDSGEITDVELLCRDTMPAPVEIGLAERPANPTCRALDETDTRGVQATNAFPLLQFDWPVSLVMPPGDPTWFVVEQDGFIRSFDDDPATDSSTIVLDIAARVAWGYEPGLLGLAFHPDWPSVREAFVYYTTELQPGWTLPIDDPEHPYAGVLSRFTVDLDGTFDLDSEEVLIYSLQATSEHNGGWMGFGADGYLYSTIGDGGAWPPDLALDLGSLRGKVLRIDVDTADAVRGLPYGIPAGNPFANEVGAQPEIWAYGLRNPWRGGFDSDTGELWIGDVGLASFEELNRIEAGGNYGWGDFEGEQCRVGETYETTAVDCDLGDTEPPEFSYRHAYGCAITAGPVYRGVSTPALAGKTIYVDFCLGNFRAYDGATGEDHWLLDTDNLVSSFAADGDGEILFVDWYYGTVHRLTAGAPADPGHWLSETGCVDEADPRAPAAGAIPYMPNAPFFSEDRVYKRRFMFLPDGEMIFVSQTNNEWAFAPGTVLMKTFQSGDRYLETRLMMANADGDWSGWSYRWNEDQTDAELVEVAVDVTVPGPTEDDPSIAWRYPDGGECVHCHTAPTNRALGPETAQLNGPAYYASEGVWALQLQTLESIGALRNFTAGDIATAPALANPADQSADLNDRARAWLHVNCAGCHQPGGGGYGGADYRWFTPLSDIGVCDQPTAVSTLGLPPGTRVILPGDPDRSLLYERIIRTDSYRMHPYRNTVDEAGAALIRAWIASLDDCDDATSR